MIVFKIVQILLTWPGRLIFGISSIGSKNVPKTGGAIIASTHIHLLDPFSHAFAQPRAFYSMAKAELFGNWFFNGIMRLVGAFPVRRGHRDKGSVEGAVRLLKKGRLLMLFPEGHRSEDGRPLEFKPGVVLIAHMAGVPIIPAVVIAPNRYRLFGGVKVIYGPPVTVSELGVAAADSRELREASAALRNIALGMLAQEARRIG
jgi:1-acyl-sn-glycerol-3-phosphate acyltransferase